MKIPIFQYMCNIKSKINAAKESIVLIDDAIDDATIELIEDAKTPDVKVTIFSRNRFYVSTRNIKRRKNFRGGFSYYQTNEFRDRYLLIDGKMLYLMTRPLKYNDKRRFYYMRVMGDRELTNVKKCCEMCEEKAARMYRHF